MRAGRAGELPRALLLLEKGIPELSSAPQAWTGGKQGLRGFLKFLRQGKRCCSDCSSLQLLLSLIKKKVYYLLFSLSVFPELISI